MHRILCYPVSEERPLSGALWLQSQRFQMSPHALTFLFFARLKAGHENHLTRGKGIRRFLSALDGQPQSLEDWDEQAWNLLVSRVIIQRDGCVEFVFRGEITITVRAA